MVIKMINKSCNNQIFLYGRSKIQYGATLIEIIVFVVVISMALLVMLRIMGKSLIDNNYPLVQIRALECAQGKMDQVLARKFDQNTPSGGVPACGSAEVDAAACAGIMTDSRFNDLGDYHNTTDNSWKNCSITTEVISAGSELGIALSDNEQFRRITITALSDGGGEIILSAYRGNF